MAVWWMVGFFLAGRAPLVGFSRFSSRSLCFLVFVGLLWVVFRYLLRVSFPLSLCCFVFSSLM